MQFQIVTSLASLLLASHEIVTRKDEVDAMREAAPDSFSIVEIAADGTRTVLVHPKVPSAPSVVSPVVAAAYGIESAPAPRGWTSVETHAPDSPAPAPSSVPPSVTRMDSDVVVSAFASSVPPSNRDVAPVRPGMERRVAEVHRMPLLGDAARKGRDRVRAEKRIDLALDSREIGRSVRVVADDNGRKRIVIADGFALSERAIRGLVSRIESDALGYVLGLRNRIATERTNGAKANEARMEADRQEIVRVLARECATLASVPCKVRARESLKDVFAVVSPSYSNADAPESIDELLSSAHLSEPGVRGDFSYDPSSTAWRVRAVLANPSPVQLQAVGEPFSFHVDISGRDNGTGRWIAGGGTEIWSCSNGAVRIVDGTSTRRIHRGNVLREVDAAIRCSLDAAAELIKAWGVNRTIEAEIPSKVTIEDAIPGFYRAMLRDDRDLVKVGFRGQREEIVKGLSAAYFGERRDPERVTRSDLAQGWTKYIQRTPLDVRSEAEAAIGAWLARATESHSPAVPYRAA